MPLASATSSDRAPDGATGRDGFIISEALAVAIIVLGQLPDIRRPDSNLDDMRRLLAAMCGDGGEWAMDLARRHLHGRPIEVG
jgi:hypothetical protein